MKIVVILAALCAVLFASSAEARPRHTSPQHGEVGCSGPAMRTCEGSAIPASFFGEEINRKSLMRHGHLLRASREKEITHHNATRPIPIGLRRVMADGAGRVIGGRPAGCPRAFCGCGASLYLFGKIVPALNLAANWLRFPRAEPKPGMVAVRRHHVFVLVRQIRGPIWMAHDSNSGHHRTRIHPRSIAGFVIVNPGAGA